MNPELEWSQFRLPLVLLLVVLLASVGWWHGARAYHQQMRQLHQTRQQELAKYRKLYRETQQTVAVLQQSLQTYQSLEHRGFLGREQRLNWMTQLHRIKQKYELPFLEFKIARQTPHPLPALTLDPQFQLFESRMTLDLDVLHENMLLDILQELETTQAAGLHRIQRCTLARTSGDTLSITANLRVSCVLQWYTAEIGKD